MPVQFNHTIVEAEDRDATADFLVELLGLEPAGTYGPFRVVELSNGVSLDVVQAGGPVRPRQPGRINTNDGGRGVYWSDPNGHNLEIITRPYGG